MLTWDDTYSIALSLCELHPNVCFEEVSLNIILEWTLQLPEFQDDPEMANEEVLLAIFQDWFEEKIVYE